MLERMSDGKAGEGEQTTGSAPSGTEPAPWEGLVKAAGAPPEFAETGGGLVKATKAPSGTAPIVEKGLVKAPLAPSRIEPSPREGLVKASHEADSAARLLGMSLLSKCIGKEKGGEEKWWKDPAPTDGCHGSAKRAEELLATSCGGGPWD